MAKHAKSGEKGEAQDRLALEDRLADLRKNVREINRQIETTTNQLEAVKVRERQDVVRSWEALKALVPTPESKKVLDDCRIEIVYTNNLIRRRVGAKAFLSQGLDAAKALNSLFQEIGVTAELTVRTWGTTGAYMQAVALDGENETKELPPNRNFEIPAKYIKTESRSINEKEKGKNYIVITTGNIYSGNIKELTESLAALEHNPQATLDFVVCNETEKTPVDRLVNALKNTPAGKQINLVRVQGEGEILDAVKGVIKSNIAAHPCVAGNIDTPSEELKVGQRVEDGALFAGISPDTHKPMYAASADESLPFSFERAKERAEQKSRETGKEYRVPTENELSVLFNNRAAIGGFNITDTGPAGWYMSSTPYYYDTLRCQCFSAAFRALSRKDVLKQQKNQKDGLFHLLLNRLQKQEKAKNNFGTSYEGFKGLGYRDSNLSVRLVRS